MKSVLLLCTVVGAVSDASKCQADENTLLQGRHTMRKQKTAGSKDAKAMLKDAREVANSLVEGSDSTMSQDAVTDTLDAAIAALTELRQATLQQIANAQQQITDASGGFQTCTTAEATASQQSVAQRAAAVESCQNTLDQLRTAETQQCNTAEDCLCDEARVRTTDQEALCTVVTETYETVFCEHHHMCTSFQQCHSLQAEVYQRLTADVEAETALIVQEYIAVEQSLCLNRLSREAMTPPRTRISRADRDACDVVDVSQSACLTRLMREAMAPPSSPIQYAEMVACNRLPELSINYPAAPAPPTCPAHRHGDPPCVQSSSGATVVGRSLRALEVGQAASVTLRDDQDFTAGVACCSTDRSLWPAHRRGTKWTSEVACGPPGHYYYVAPAAHGASCSRAVTFAAAREVCSGFDFRLCSATEVAACYFTGCSLSGEHNSGDTNIWIEP